MFYKLGLGLGLGLGLKFKGKKEWEFTSYGGRILKVIVVVPSAC